MEAQTLFDTKPLLRPDQVESAKSEIASLEAKLSNPLIQEKGAVRAQLARSRKSFEDQVPRPPQDGEEAASMERRSKELLDTIVGSMCSQEEMRKAPPGAVDKFRRGENSPAMKRRIAEWKHIQLRLTAGSSDREAANLERYRPKTSTLNMDSAQIQGKQFHMPDTAGPSVIFSNEQLAQIRALNPAVADMLALLSNVDRQTVKDAVVGIGLAERSPSSEAGHKGAARKRQLSAEQKQKMQNGARAAREAKAKKA